MQNLGGKQSVLWAIGKWSIQEGYLHSTGKTICTTACTCYRNVARRIRTKNACTSLFQLYLLGHHFQS